MATAAAQPPPHPPTAPAVTSSSPSKRPASPPPRKAKRAKAAVKTVTVSKCRTQFPWIATAKGGTAVCECGGKAQLIKEKLRAHAATDKHAAWERVQLTNKKVDEMTVAAADTAVEIRNARVVNVAEAALVAAVPFATLERFLSAENLALIDLLHGKVSRRAWGRGRDALCVLVYEERDTRSRLLPEFAIYIDETPYEDGTPCCHILIVHRRGAFLFFSGLMEGKKADDFVGVVRTKVFSVVDADRCVCVGTDGPNVMLSFAEQVKTITSGAFHATCGMHHFNLVEMHGLDAYAGARSAVAFVSAALFGRGDLAPRRGRLLAQGERFGMTKGNISSLDVSKGRFHHHIVAAELIVKHQDIFCTFFESEDRAHASDTVKKALIALRDVATGFELLTVVELYGGFGDLIRHVQGRDRLCFGVSDRRMLDTFDRAMASVYERDKATSSDLPRAVRNKLRGLADLQQAARIESQLLVQFFTAASTYMRLDTARIKKWMCLHKVVTLAYPDVAKDDLGRFAGLDAATPGEVLSNLFFDNLFNRLLVGVNDIKLVTDLKGYIDFLRTAGADVVHGDAADFWEKHQLKWPALTVVMNRCLCVLLSIAPVEASFSMLRHTDTAERQSLLAENRDLEMFLHFNGARRSWNLPTIAP